MKNSDGKKEKEREIENTINRIRKNERHKERE